MAIFQTDIKEHSGLKYRIQLRPVHGGWEQRHIWFPAPATYVARVKADEWIWSGREGPIENGWHIAENPDADFEAQITA